jgi:hypothetical protein
MKNKSTKSGLEMNLKEVSLIWGLLVRYIDEEKPEDYKNWMERCEEHNLEKGFPVWIFGSELDNDNWIQNMTRSELYRLIERVGDAVNEKRETTTEKLYPSLCKKRYEGFLKKE